MFLCGALFNLQYTLPNAPGSLVDLVATDHPALPGGCERCRGLERYTRARPGNGGVRADRRPAHPAARAARRAGGCWLLIAYGLVHGFQTASRQRNGLREPWEVDPLKRKVYVQSVTALLDRREGQQLRGACADRHAQPDISGLSEAARSVLPLLGSSADRIAAIS
jgi:hypothetical protein